ncbi:MAG: Ger(x)C family spore germination protein [Firmicutes bacterium]|nr:Ger(x)C family spore germination protein [Bacillota bacterium]
MRFIKIAFIILLLVSFASCKDAQEPETLGYVVAIGIDIPEENKEGYNITIQFANPDKISGGSSESGGKGGSESIENITVLAPGIYPAVNIANHIISKKFVLSHTKVIVFSDEVAKQGIKDFLETINRNSDIRPNIYFAVSKGPAKEFLEAVDPKTEVNPVRYYTMIFENDYSGFIPQNMSQDFYLFYNSDEKSTVMPLCAVVNPEKRDEFSELGYQYKVDDYVAGEIPTSNSQIQIAGMAIFERDIKIAEVGDIKTEIFNIVTGEYQSSFVSYYFSKMPETPVIVMQLQKKKPKFSVDTKTKVPKIDVTIYLEGDLSSGKAEEIVEREIENFSKEAALEVKRQTEVFFEETKELGADVIGFGSYAKRNFKTIKAFDEYNWKEAYKNAQINVKVEFSIRRTGLIVRGENKWRRF